MMDGRCCPACGRPTGDVSALARHLVGMAEASDGTHVMWLNRHVTKHRTTADGLEKLLAPLVDGGPPPAERVRR